MVKLIHSGDWHLDADPIHQEKAKRSLEQMGEYMANIKVDYLLNPGDMFEKLQQHKKDTGVELGHYYLKNFAKLLKYIVITKGNESHDATGSIALLHQIANNILAYEYPVVLGMFKDRFIDLLRVPDIDEFDESMQPEMIIDLMPYPTKSALITDKSIDSNNADYGAVFDGLMDVFHIVNSRFKCPKALGFHGNVQGAKLSNGQVLLGQDIIISPLSLERAGADYYGLAHIHLHQMIRPRMWYSGSLYNKNHGEEDQKYFQVVTFDNGEVEIEGIKLEAARPMVTVEAEFKEGKFVYDKQTPSNAEVRFKYKVAENERGFITNENLTEIRAQFGDDVKIDQTIIPVQRETRSEKIMEAKTIIEEIKAYAETTNEEITSSILKKIEKLQEVTNAV